MREDLARVRSESDEADRCRGDQGGVVGLCGGVREFHFDGNRIEQGSKRGAAQQDKSYPRNQSDTLPRSCKDSSTLKS